MSGPPLASYLTYAIAPERERRRAVLVTLGLLGAVLGTVPFATTQLGTPDALLPAITSATAVAMLVSAAMLRNQYHTTRYVPLAILAQAYALTAFLLIPYALSFPHVFSPDAFGLGSQTAPWLWIAWHASFVLLLAGYAWSDSYFSRKAIDVVAGAEFVRRYRVLAIVTTGAAAGAILWFHARLPILIANGAYTQAYHLLVEQLLLASACIVLAVLVARTSLRSTTHLWLAVTLVAFAIEVYLNGAIVSARFSVAWYMGFLEAGVWQTLFLFVQLRDSSVQLAAIAADSATLHEEAQRDALTGCFNRRGYEHRYELAVAESHASSSATALLAIDIDYFKRFNDHFGHLVGDDALRSVVTAMTAAVSRPADAVCRMGGDEFVVVLAATDERGAAAVAERIRAGIARLRIRSAPDVPIATMSVSVGVALSLPGERGAQALYERADKALYRAKNLGRNRVIGNADGRGDGNLRVV